MLAIVCVWCGTLQSPILQPLIHPCNLMFIVIRGVYLRFVGVHNLRDDTWEPTGNVLHVMDWHGRCTQKTTRFVW